GDLAFACFPLAKVFGKSPAEIATQMIPVGQVCLDEAAQQGQIPEVDSLQAVGPYMNLHFRPGSLASFICSQVANANPPYGAPLPKSGQLVMVEYSAPNTNKPLHVGHIRNNLLGLSLCNILAATGDEVIPVNLVNDRGIHIAKSMLAYRKWGGGQTPESTGRKGDHLVGEFYVRFNRTVEEEKADLAREEGLDLTQLDKDAKLALEDRTSLMRETREVLRKWEEGDPEVRALWEKMNRWVYAGFDETYSRLGCIFKKWYFESETYMSGKQLVEDGLNRGIFQRHPDGSVWARLEEEGLKDKILLRADGTSVYITQDLGTAVLKFAEFGMDRSLYVVASEQNLHFQLLFTLLHKLGFAWADGCHHLSYGMVNLRGGMGKLKSREGRAVDADNLLDELARIAKDKAQTGGYVTDSRVDLDTLADAIGQGALKMYLLQVGAEKNIQFDPDTTLDFEGDTGPAVQYSHARICSIARKALATGKIALEDLVVADLPQPFAGLGTGSPVAATAKRFPSAGQAIPESGSSPSRGATPVDPVVAARVSRSVGLQPERADTSLLEAEEERHLCLELALFPSVLKFAAAQMSPAPVAGYLLDLTKAYARFYHNCPVLRAESEPLTRARLHLSLVVAATLRRGLSLLGIHAPDAM
ncbi:MAG: arginine--tRNA ligase, partial [Candidatus Eisenbacteria sp.]|nr:arginine--tRNA ligase [Candidatus Eisenbacteria bacterium]